jgi:hypothetical protein
MRFFGECFYGVFGLSMQRHVQNRDKNFLKGASGFLFIGQKQTKISIGLEKFSTWIFQKVVLGVFELLLL